MRFLGKPLVFLFLVLSFCIVGNSANETVTPVDDVPSIQLDIHKESNPKGQKLVSDEDESEFPDRPLQIVRPDSKHKSLEIVEENMKYLHRIKGNVTAVAVVGKFHSGKSFLMNQLKQKSSGFDIGSKVTPDTKGIWIWGNPIQTNEENKKWILFLDTEGFAANNITENYDAKIFAVASLLSSKLIYNSVRTIDRSDIDYLELLAQRAELFSHNVRMLPQKNSDDNKPSVDIENLLKFPNLLWVIRDFVQNTANEECKSWMMKILKTHGQEKEKYSFSLEDIFPSVDCHTLFIPSADKKLLCDLSNAKDDDLTSEYCKDRNSLMEKIYADLGEGQTKFNSGTEIATVLQSLVANQELMPNILNRWDAFLESQKKLSIENSYNFYLSYLGRDSNFEKGEPMSEENLEIFYQASCDKAIDLLKVSLKGLDELFEDSVEKLRELFEKHRTVLFNENNSRIQLKILSISQEIQKQISDDSKVPELPALSKELEKFFEQKNEDFEALFVEKINGLVSRESLKSSFDEIKKIIRLNYDSISLQNQEKIGKLLSQKIDEILPQAFVDIQIDSSKPMTPEACNERLETLMNLSIEQFSKEAGIYIEEKSIHENSLGKLKSLLQEQMAMIKTDNEQAIKIYLKNEVKKLTQLYDHRAASKYSLKFPMKDEVLENFLNNDSMDSMVIYHKDFLSYRNSSVYMDTYDEFMRKINKINKKFKKANSNASRQAVDEHLDMAKKIILYKGKDYRTRFSFTQFAKKIYHSQLNLGKANEWSKERKNEIIDRFLNEDHDLKRELDSRSGLFFQISQILPVAVVFFVWLILYGP